MFIFHETGEIGDEKKVLAWFTDQGNLELADQIEEVNEKMLKKLIGSSAHVVAFFCNQLCCHLERIFRNDPNFPIHF